jgi:predicted hotdog family 3-hydroxylacyl-ACP dehydratase
MIMAGEVRIPDLIPHAGPMCLLERIVRWDAQSVTTATISHRAATNPLAVDGRLHAIHLCEYGAQAMAVHGGLAALSRGERARPGVLVSLRDVTLACEFVEGFAGELIVEARRLHDSGAAWQYDFRVEHAGRQLAQGRAIVSVASRS